MPRILHLHNGHPHLRLDRSGIAKAIQLLDEHSDDFRGGCPKGELSLAFLTDEALAKIHGDFLDDPSKTDVITFEGDPTHGVAGEICVSVDTAAQFAKEHNQNFSDELTLYVVHGWLHLAGFDDLQPKKKREMRAAEKKAFKILSNAKRLPKFLLKRQ